jgi:hypothetical protein
MKSRGVTKKAKKQLIIFDRVMRLPALDADQNCPGILPAGIQPHRLLKRTINIDRHCVSPNGYAFRPLSAK